MLCCTPWLNDSGSFRELLSSRYVNFFLVATSTSRIFVNFTNRRVNKGEKSLKPGKKVTSWNLLHISINWYPMKIISKIRKNPPVRIFVIIEKLFFTIIFKKSKKQLLQIWSYIVLVEIKVFRNNILSNFNLSNHLPRVHGFPSSRLQSWSY